MPTESLVLAWLPFIPLISFLVFSMILLCEYFVRPIVFKIVIKLPFIVWCILEITIICTTTFLLYNIFGEFHDFYFIGETDLSKAKLKIRK